MLNKSQLIALYTLVRRELIRMFRIFTQVFLPPIITTFLYFLIFGTLIGKRIGPIQG
ncbi:MAG TPA: ABC transporter permease, partial [Legionellales bacterium]|nr:ABC transporter permease [Legionellales bacterium]